MEFFLAPGDELPRIRPMLRMRLRDQQAFPVVILLCCSGPSLFAQTQTAGQKQTATSEVMFDPTQREVQPPLSVDRDPVLSPDPENTAPSPDITGYTLRPGEIQQQKSGEHLSCGRAGRCNKQGEKS
jgi:hypothetical protein